MLVFILLWQVIVTELMADPSPAVALPVCEYLELHNISGEPVQMKGWTLRCGRTEKVFPSCMLRPGGYLLVCSAEAAARLAPYGDVCPLWTSAATLSNEGGRVTLSDASGTERHALAYDLTWYRDVKKKNGGWSLERVADDPPDSLALLPCVLDDADAWRASADPSGGTPGAASSWLAYDAGSGVTLRVEPDPVTPDGDGWGDEAHLFYTLPSADWRYDLMVFSRQGTLVRRLARDAVALSRGEVVWDGRDASGRSLPAGMYVVVFRAYHTSGQVALIKRVVTVTGQ